MANKRKRGGCVSGGVAFRFENVESYLKVAIPDVAAFASKYAKKMESPDQKMLTDGVQEFALKHVTKSKLKLADSVLEKLKDDITKALKDALKDAIKDALRNDKNKKDRKMGYPDPEKLKDALKEKLKDYLLDLAIDSTI
jgi:hypothetical protein